MSVKKLRTTSAALFASRWALTRWKSRKRGWLWKTSRSSVFEGLRRADGPLQLTCNIELKETKP